MMVPFGEKDTFMRRQRAQQRGGLQCHALRSPPQVGVFVWGQVLPAPVTQTAKAQLAQEAFVAGARTAFVQTACHSAVPEVKEQQLAPLSAWDA